jgi:putative ABC transport system permease protein
MRCAMSSTSKQNSALAALRKVPRPIFAVLAVFALGLGVNTAIFTVSYLEFAGLYPRPDELVVLRSKIHGHENGISTGDFVRWRKQATVFQDLNASTEGAFRVTTPDGMENVPASLVTPGFYPMMGDRFYLGYNFISEDGMPGRDRVVILAHAMWKRLGANRGIIGAPIFMDGEPYTVVGVLAPGLRDRGAPVTVPLFLKPERGDQGDQRMNVVGRLRPGISIREAQANIDAIVSRTTHGLESGRMDWRVSVEPIRGASPPNDRKLVIWLLLGGGVFFLLFACASVANLLRLRADAGYRLHKWCARF